MRLKLTHAVFPKPCGSAFRTGEYTPLRWCMRWMALPATWFVHAEPHSLYDGVLAQWKSSTSSFLHFGIDGNWTNWAISQPHLFWNCSIRGTAHHVGCCPSAGAPRALRAIRSEHLQSLAVYDVTSRRVPQELTIRFQSLRRSRVRRSEIDKINPKISRDHPFLLISRAADGGGGGVERKLPIRTKSGISFLSLAQTLLAAVLLGCCAI